MRCGVGHVMRISRYLGSRADGKLFPACRKTNVFSNAYDSNMMSAIDVGVGTLALARHLPSWLGWNGACDLPLYMDTYKTWRVTYIPILRDLCLISLSRTRQKRLHPISQYVIYRIYFLPRRKIRFRVSLSKRTLSPLIASYNPDKSV